MRCLLDTHVWIWLVTGARPIRPSTLPVIEQALNRGDALLSIMSIWELGLLVEKDLIELDTTPRDWVDLAVSSLGVEVLDLTIDIALRCHGLPVPMTGDPVDRVLVASALEHEAVLVSRDPELLRLGTAGLIEVLPA